MAPLSKSPKRFHRLGSFGARARAFFQKGGKKVNLEETAGPPKEQEIEQEHQEPGVEDVVIVGAGIVGLVLALSLHKHSGITPKVYEQAQAFHDDVGAGMGMYPNGLRVIRDISPDLLRDIHEAGYPYLYRRWERHDGTQVAISEEKILTNNNKIDNGLQQKNENSGNDDDPHLHPLGIRRWRLQKILFQAAEAAGIPIYFNKRLESVVKLPSLSSEDQLPDSDEQVQLTFADGTTVTTKLLLAADGSKSLVRNLCADAAIGGKQWKMKYTGVTCLMGTSSTPRRDRGICLPASETTKCHGAFYPTGPNEQCFQFHFPTPLEEAGKASAGSWGTLTEHVGQEECTVLRERLEKDGWDKKYLQPLENVDKAIKIGFSVLEPPLESYVYDNIVLLGDAAHPPVPYLGQGAQQGLEDAGTFALLFEHLLMADDDTTTSSSSKQESPLSGGQETAATTKNKTKKFSTANLSTALQLYNTLRVPRTREVLEHSKTWGKTQQKRTECPRYNRVKEQKIQREVFFHETVSDLLLGVQHDYKAEALQAIHQKVPELLAVPAEQYGEERPSSLLLPS